MKEKLNELSELTPIEILNDFRNRYYNDGNSTENGIVANALNDIMPRMIVPPVKVGQTVYQIDDTRVYELKVNGVCDIIYDTDAIAFSQDIIGKRIFLTREAAEEALKARENEKNH